MENKTKEAIVEWSNIAYDGLCGDFTEKEVNVLQAALDKQEITEITATEFMIKGFDRAMRKFRKRARAVQKEIDSE